MKAEWFFYKEADALPPEFLEDPEKVIKEKAQLLKSSGYHREVYRLDDLLIKAFTFSNFLEKLKWKKGFSAPQREWNIQRVLHKEGLSVPEPIALGSLKENKAVKVWLVSRYIDNCVTYDQMRPDWQSLDASERAEKLAQLISGMHAAFVVHRDLHAGNILSQPETKTWYLTDVQHARRGFSTRVQLEEDLTQLQHCLGKKVPYRLRIVFLKAYIWNFAVVTDTTETHSGKDWHSVWYEVSERLLSYDRSQARSRSNRAFKKNRDFAPIEGGFMRKGESSVLIEDVIRKIKENCPPVYEHPQGRVAIESGPASLIWRPERRIWRAAARLALLHIPCERPLLVMRTGRLWAYAYLMRGVYTLKELPLSADKERLILQMAKITARMHNCGVVHGSYTLSNIALSEGGELYLRDFCKTSFSNSVSWFGRVGDLSKLLASCHGLLSSYEQRLFLRKYVSQLTEDIDCRLLITDVSYKASIEINERQK